MEYISHLFKHFNAARVAAIPLPSDDRSFVDTQTFLSDKFDITKHKRYKELSDFDKKNAFDVERYLKHELRLRMDEEFDCYEVDVSEESTA